MKQFSAQLHTARPVASGLSGWCMATCVPSSYLVDFGGTFRNQEDLGQIARTPR
jgi:hypothetical protein